MEVNSDVPVAWTGNTTMDFLNQLRHLLEALLAESAHYIIEYWVWLLGAVWLILVIVLISIPYKLNDHYTRLYSDEWRENERRRKAIEKLLKKHGQFSREHKLTGRLYGVLICLLFVFSLSALLFWTIGLPRPGDDVSTFIEMRAILIKGSTGVIAGLGIVVPIMLSVWSQLIESRYRLLRDVETQLGDSTGSRREYWNEFHVNLEREVVQFRQTSGHFKTPFYILTLLSIICLFVIVYSLIALPGLAMVHIHFASALSAFGLSLVATLIFLFVLAIVSMQPFISRIDDTLWFSSIMREEIEKDNLEDPRVGGIISQKKRSPLQPGKLGRYAIAGVVAYQLYRRIMSN